MPLLACSVAAQCLSGRAVRYELRWVRPPPGRSHFTICHPERRNPQHAPVLRVMGWSSARLSSPDSLRVGRARVEGPAFLELQLNDDRPMITDAALYIRCVTKAKK